MLNKIQTEIYTALVQLSQKELITEAILAKKIRENNGIKSKNKAGLSLSDVEAAVVEASENNQLFYSIHANSANDLLLKKVLEAREMDGETRRRRLKSEKSKEILTNGDFPKAKKQKGKKSPGYEGD